VLIGQRNYEAEIYNKHTEVVKVSKHQGDCGLCYMTQIIVNSAKFTTALNATKTAHCSSQLLQKKSWCYLKKEGWPLLGGWSSYRTQIAYVTGIIYNVYIVSKTWEVSYLLKAALAFRAGGLVAGCAISCVAASCSSDQLTTFSITADWSVELAAIWIGCSLLYW